MSTAVIVVGNISIDGGPPRPCVVSGIADTPGIWGGGNVPMPTPPIYLPGQPPGIWGGGNVPMPTPPIYIPGQPPGIWGGGNVPMPTPPIHIPPPAPGVPTHPIYWPPVISGPPGPWPTPPIHLPPPGSGGGGDIDPGGWQWVWSPVYGWVLQPGGGDKPRPPGGGGEGGTAPPPTDPNAPHPDQTLPGDLPPDAAR